ncbi:MAG: hypothetical protein HUU21_17020 [Polyangiaceae bacterium]|nr:hypothetical protein [Polyangiaceae bacterium]
MSNSFILKSARAALPGFFFTALVPLAMALSACSGSDDVPDTSGTAPPIPPPTPDALPAGAISFFNATSCPVNWTPFAEAKGRFLVPTIGQDPPLKTVGEPLKDGEDRMHSHAVTAEADLDAVSYAGIAGEANHGVAGQQKVTLAAPAAKVSSGLPYVQLLACKKLGSIQAGAVPVPKGFLMFWNGASCPAGYSQPIATQGRMLVGVPKDAPPGLSFGGKSLASAEDRKHGHDVAGSFMTSPHGIALASGCCADGYAKDGQYDYAGATDEGNAGLPVIQLLQCQKM